MGKHSAPEWVHMILVPSPRGDAEVIGLHPVRDRMERVNRIPGESQVQMLFRARQTVRGTGVVIVRPLHSDEA